jgi:UDP-2-acetamido-3-amino-2,3-dideoxy-glucuronate N-acetyltransferase
VIHPTADIEEGARVGPNTHIWHYAQIRAGAVVGAECNLGHSVYVDHDAVVGDRVKLQNRVSVYRGVTIEDGVFVGPHTTFTNDKYPRAVTHDGRPLRDEDWVPVTTLVRSGASIGAGCVVLPGVTIGRWAMVGAGSVVTSDVPDHGLVHGTPARLVGYACRCGHPLREDEGGWTCTACQENYNLPPLGASHRASR